MPDIQQNPESVTDAFQPLLAQRAAAVAAFGAALESLRPAAGRLATALAAWYNALPADIKQRYAVPAVRQARVRNHPQRRHNRFKRRGA